MSLHRAITGLRVVILISALAVAVWFAVGVRQAIDTDRATVIVTSAATLSQTQARRAGSLLSSAGFLNPDRQVDLLRSQVALARGDLTRARQIAASVTRQEPLNAQGWAQLARASRGPAFAGALRHVIALVPPVRRRH